MLRLTTLITFLLAALPAQSGTLEDGQRVVREFQEGRMVVLWQRMTPAMHKALGRPETLGKLRDSLQEKAGPEQELLDETVEPVGGGEIYTRLARHRDTPLTISTRVVFDDLGRIAGFRVTPERKEAESRFLDYRTKAGLRLPLDGEWFVFWGGRSLAENYHAADKGQRFAYDLLVVKDGASHAGSGRDPADYYCWDRPILAPAGATVVEIENYLPDNAIGSTDADNPLGNHVILDLMGGEFAFLAHMREGSVIVSPGDKVKAGDVIGRCGNSGNTSEPHLHFHLQTTGTLGTGEGLPAQFQDYRANGETVERGEPKRGQTVSPG